jgi:hypothetical protein
VGTRGVKSGTTVDLKIGHSTRSNVSGPANR